MKKNYNNSSKHSINSFFYISFILFCGFMILASVFQLFGYSKDYIGYKMIFTFDYGIKRENTEPFFCLLRYLNDFFLHSSIYSIFFFTALFSFLFKWTAFKEITGYNSYFLFVLQTFCFFPILEYTQIRASCAIAIFLYAIPDLVNGHTKSYLIKSIVAITFHYSAFFMLILFVYIHFFKSKTMYILLPIIGLIFAIACSKVFGSRLRDLLYVVENIVGLNKSGNISNFMSVFNFKYLMLLFTFFINALVTPENDTRNIILLKIMSFGLCIYYWLNPLYLPVISVRLAEFFTSVFVLYFFLNIKNFPIKEKSLVKLYCLLVALLYAIASIRTGLL